MKFMQSNPLLLYFFHVNSWHNTRDFAGLLYIHNPETGIDLHILYFMISRGDIFLIRGYPTHE